LIDIHSHVLYGLDDGAADRQMSLAMLKMAAETGTTDIVATPHADVTYSFRPDLVAECVADLAEASGGTPRLHTGCDFHLQYENIQDAIANPTRYTINHKSYLLVEFSDLVIFPNTGEILDSLMASGMRPIITHPERNELLQQRVAMLAEWAERGCLLQVTSGSLFGDFGGRARKTAEELMNRGLVHFVASDAHDCTHRPPRLDRARERVADRWGPETAERLFVSNPAAVLTGEPLPSPPPPAHPGPSRRKWYKFWT
jgi:protein-tyrosine phosphatase